MHGSQTQKKIFFRSRADTMLSPDHHTRLLYKGKKLTLLVF